MFATLTEWAPFIGLVLLGWILRSSIEAIYERVKKRIDDKIPDYLPIGGGAWLQGEVEKRSLDVRIVAAPRKAADVDAYIPSARIIVLSRDTFEKRDPSFWAVAAHELGHTLAYRSSPLVRWPLLAARIMSRSCAEIATFLIIANVLYANREVDSAAFAMLAASVVAYAFVLVDEGLASVIGIKVVAGDERIDRRALVGAVSRLLAAFMTYVGGFVGQLVLLVRRDFVIAQIERHRHFVPGRPLGGINLLIVSILAILLFVLSLREIKHELRPRDFTTAEEVTRQQLKNALREVVRGLLGSTIVWLVWDQPQGPRFAIICVLGLLASRVFVKLVAGVAEIIVRLVAVLLIIPLYVPIYVATYVALHLFCVSLPEEASPSPFPEPPDPEGARFAEVFDSMQVDLYNRPLWYPRAKSLAFPALHIAFVIALCLEVLVP